MGLKDERLRLYKHDTAKGDQRDRQQKGGRHHGHKFAVRNVELRVEIQVLRIAEGREHTAEVGGNVLHDEGKGHVFVLARRMQNEEAERQEGQKRHVVGDEHRPQEGDVNECQHAHPRVFEALDDALREDIEKANVFERTYDGQHAEQAGQSFEIQIAEIVYLD